MPRIYGQRPKPLDRFRAVRLAMYAGAVAATLAALYMTFRYVQRVIQFEGW